MRIAFLNWRDTANPEGGGSEVYIEEIGRRLVAAGHEVTLICAAYEGSRAEEFHKGMRILRRGSKLTVYGQARRILRSGELGPIDVVVDTQNGIPFLSPWAVSSPVVVLVHHVHREQWPVVYDPVRARVGWWIESVLAPRVYRRHSYVTVSRASAEELQTLGVDADRINVIHNGIDDVGLRETAARDLEPRILVLGRLVPHKRVEHVLEAASRLRGRFAGLRVAVVGDGWWSDPLHQAAWDLGVADIVEFLGHVSADEKARQIDRAWVLALPSLKEGWGIVVLEAAARGVPAVAYRDAGGVTESILDGESGLLVDGGSADFTDALADILGDETLRDSLGAGARTHACRYSWDESAAQFARVIEEAAFSQSSHRRRTGHPRSGAQRSATQ